MKLSICILSYNRRQELNTTLRLLASNVTLQHQIVVVENGSTDGSATMVRSEFPEVDLVELTENMGAPALNKGFEISKGDYILVLDDDSHPEKGLNEAIEFLDNNPDVGALALHIVGGSYRIKSKRHLEEIMGYIGCGVIFRSSTIQDAGGYPPWIFLYANEWEHAIRIRQSGYSIRYFDTCSIVHRVAASHRSNRRLRSLTTRNELLILERYFDNDPRKDKLMRRTVRWNRLFCLLEGRMTFSHVKEGIELYQTDRHTIAKVSIDQTVRDSYVQEHWSLQPLFPALILKFMEALKEKLGPANA
ncbi:glycosyltransferase family 2 protein [Coraliomargarita parva]|uniref:glycosyltransferase family 2 protein n=1 Tax=Coraliomargarita parva TaxID=3014050 RepID=UPI0022B5B729|nr:glycosyltransferase [Coraliomargarita parva]